MYKKLNKKNGFTLIELMIAIAVISILSGVMLPDILKMITNHKLKSSAKDLYSNMQKVRFQAINQNETVALAFTAVAFSPAGGVGSYQIFIDNGVGGGTANDLIQNGAEPTLKTVTMLRSVSLVTAAFSGTSSAGFNSRGLPARSRFGNVVLQNQGTWYKITLSIAGNLKLEISNDGATWKL